MKNISWFLFVILIIIGCKTQHSSINQLYMTPWKVEMLTTDIPESRKNKKTDSELPPLSLVRDSDLLNKTDSLSIKSINKKRKKNSSNKKLEKQINKKQKKNKRNRNNRTSKKDSIAIDSLNFTSPISYEDSFSPNNVYELECSLFSWEIGILQTQILDVRSAPEYNQGHLYDAINIEINQPYFTDQIEDLDKSRPVAIYSNTQKRSQEAAKILKERNFELIYILKGGLDQWKTENREIIK